MPGAVVSVAPPPPPAPRAAEQAGPAAWVLTWLFNLPAECSFSPVKQSGVSGCCPSLPCPQNVWPFIPASESSLSRPEMLIYGCNNRIWTRLSLTAHGCLRLLMVAPVKSRLLLHLIFRFQHPIFLLRRKTDLEESSVCIIRSWGQDFLAPRIPGVYLN